MASGRTADYRIVPETLNDGLLADLPLELEDVATLTSGKTIDRIKAFRIYGPGIKSYERKLTVEIHRIEPSIPPP
jgi:hypothetical protein